jgi:2-isopropylmalate synthase
MPSADPSTAARAADSQTLHLARWTVASGSNVQSRGAVVIASGDHEWRASAEGNGAVDALLRAVDKAVGDVLDGDPRLVAFDVHALAEGPDAEGRVSLAITPPESATGARGTGRYEASAQSTNIIAASIEAYIAAINAMLAEEHWAGAAESAGNRKRIRDAHGRRGELDPENAEHDTTAWFER